jgi:predicted O-methyltransferase YrrM
MGMHRGVFAVLVRSAGWRSGAELGVDKGQLFSTLLDSCPALETLVGVDLGVNAERRARCEAIVAKHKPRAVILWTSTHDAADLVADSSLDFVFIDADHSEAAVADDIARWASKVRSGGWIGGHDYNAKKFPGVVRAVRRAFGAEAELYPGTIWGLTR